MRGFHRLFILGALLILSMGQTGCITGKALPPATTEEKVYQEDPVDSSCSYFYFLWGNTADYNRNYAEALEAYEKALICDPGADYIAEKIPTLLIRLGRISEAAAWLENYLKDKPTKTLQRFMLARLKIQEGKDDEAIALFQEALDIEPGNTSIRLRLGLLHAQKGEYEQAEKIFKDILDNYDESYFATLYLARLYQESGKLLKSEHFYGQALALNWSKELAYEIAELYTLHKKYNKAKKVYEDILSRDQQDERAALGIVQSLIYLKEGEAAIEKLSKIRQFSNDPERIDLISSQILVNMGENERAKIILQEILKIRPLSQAIYLLGVVLYEEANFPEALAILETIPPDATEYSDGVMLRVRILEETDRSKQSMLLLDTEIAQEKTRQPAFYSLLSAIQRKQGLQEKALVTLAAGMKNYPENEKLLYEYAILLEKNGNHERAMIIMKKILTLNKNHADALNFIGYSWADRNINLDKAYAYIRKALDLKPQSGYIQDSLGWVYYRMGAYQKARDTLLKAIELEPSDPYIYEHLGDTYRALKNNRQARKYYQKALELLTDSNKINEIKKKIEAL